MTRLFVCAWLALCCLPCHPARSQPRQRQAIAPLTPYIVTLDSGTVVPRRLVGLDTTTYRLVRINAAQDEALLSLRAQRITVYEQDATLATTQNREQQQEIERLRRAQVEAQNRFDRLGRLAQTTAPAMSTPLSMGLGFVLGVVASALVYLHWGP